MVKISALVLALGISGMLMGVQAQAAPTASREYSLKAAFLYNFIVFTDWPKEILPDNNEPMVIAVMGKDPFGDAFDPIKDQQVKGRKVRILHFKGIEELQESDKSEMDKIRKAIRKCHLLFICNLEVETLKDIITMVKGTSVLTVADTPGFLESGGMINLILEEKKVRFEINKTATDEAKLKIGSQLWRLAKRVIGENTSEAAGKH